MEDPRIERLESRVRELESELREIKVRMGMPANRPVGPLVAPPIIVQPATQQSAPNENVSQPVAQTEPNNPRESSLHKIWLEQINRERKTEEKKPKEKPEPNPKPKRSFEDFFFKVILIRYGGILVILGLLYFVQLGINSGMITPQVQFILGSLLCAGFVGFGLWKRNEQEEFGQAMVGIGSCGMYLVSAGSYTFNQLFSGNILVGIFVGLSLANLGFSAWAKSKSFLAIGVIGGLVGAVLPTQEGHFAINIVLHLIIVGLAAFICSSNRWTANAMWLWLFSSFALIPLGITDNPEVAWQSKVAAIYASTLLSAAAVGIGKPIRFDPLKLFLPLSIISAALACFAIAHGTEGVEHLAVCGVAVFGLSWLFRHEKESALQFKISSAVVLMVMAPWGLTALNALFVYTILVIESSLAVTRINKLYACIAAWTTFALSIVAYALLFDGSQPYWVIEACSIVALMLGLALASWAQTKGLSDSRPVVIASLLAVWLMLSRFAFVVLGDSPIGWSHQLSVAIGWMGFVAALNVAGRIYRMRELSILAWLVAFCSMASYINLVAVDQMPVGVDALVVGGMLALYALSATQTVSASDEQDRSWLVNVGILIALPLYSRLGWLVLKDVGLGAYVTVALLLAAASAVVAGVAMKQKWLNTVGMAWVALGGSLAAYGLYLTADFRLALAVESATILGLAAAAVYACYAWQKLGGVLEGRTVTAGAALVSLLYVRLAWVWLGNMGMQEIERAPFALALFMPAIGYVAQKRGLAYLAGFLWVPFIVASLGFVSAACSDLPSTLPMESLIGVSLALNAVWACITWAKQDESANTDIIYTVAAGLVVAFWTRLGWIWFDSIGVLKDLRLPLADVIALPILAVLAERKRFRYMAGLTWAAVLATYALYLPNVYTFRSASQGIESLVLIGMVAGPILTVFATNKLVLSKALSYSAGVLLTWWSVSRLLILWLVSFNIGLSFNASVTLSWVVYLIGLMAVGFSRRIRPVRLWGFAVIFAISMKLFLYDTITLSDMVRVAAFILAGLSFIAIGYGFIKYSAILDQESER